MKVRTASGQEFDAWVNLPENDRKVPAWLGQIAEATDTRTVIRAPDQSLLTVGPGDVVVNQSGRLVANSMRNTRRLFDIIEGEDEAEGLSSVGLVPAPDNMGRARQGMVSSHARDLPAGNAVSGEALSAQSQDNLRVAAAGSAGDSGTEGPKQDGESARQSAGEAGPAEATAAGGSGDDSGSDPAFGAVGSGGEPAAEGGGEDPPEDAGADDGPVTSHRKRGRR